MEVWQWNRRPSLYMYSDSFRGIGKKQQEWVREVQDDHKCPILMLYPKWWRTIYEGLSRNAESVEAEVKWHAFFSHESLYTIQRQNTTYHWVLRVTLRCRHVQIEEITPQNARRKARMTWEKATLAQPCFLWLFQRVVEAFHMKNCNECNKNDKNCAFHSLIRSTSAYWEKYGS